MPRTPQPAIGSPEFKALQAKWYGKLAKGKAGFDDIERAPECRPGADPGAHAAYHRDYLRPDNPRQKRHLPLAERRGIERRGPRQTDEREPTGARDGLDRVGCENGRPHRASLGGDCDGVKPTTGICIDPAPMVKKD